MGKIGLVICLLSIASLYPIQGWLFWLSIINAVVFILSSSFQAISIARPAMRKHREAVNELLDVGATEEEIEAQANFPVEPEDYNLVPKSLFVLLWITHLVSLVLLIIGIVILLL